MTTHLSPSPLVQTEWLAAHLDDADLRIVDVRFRSRTRQGRGNLADDRDDYAAGHIPGAVFVGTVTELSDPQHPIPDMLVRPELFAEVMGRLGIGDNTLVVAYDGVGLPLAAARLWWALSYYGHDRVRVLDGGLHKWQVEGRPLSLNAGRSARTLGVLAEARAVLVLAPGTCSFVGPLVPRAVSSLPHQEWTERSGRLSEGQVLARLNGIRRHLEHWVDAFLGDSWVNERG